MVSPERSEALAVLPHTGWAGVWAGCGQDGPAWTCAGPAEAHWTGHACLYLPWGGGPEWAPVELVTTTKAGDHLLEMVEGLQIFPGKIESGSKPSCLRFLGLYTSSWDSDLSVLPGNFPSLKTQPALKASSPAGPTHLSGSTGAGRAGQGSSSRGGRAAHLEPL